MDLRRRELGLIVDWDRILPSLTPPSPSSAPVEPRHYIGVACSTGSAFWIKISFFTMRTRISISVLNWLVGSVSISLSRERRSNSKFALLPTVTPRKPAVYYPSGLPKKQKSLHKVQAYPCCNQL